MKINFLKKHVMWMALGCGLLLTNISFAAETEVAEVAGNTESLIMSEWIEPGPSLEDNEVTALGRVGQGPILDRLNRLDQAIFGANRTGTVNDRVIKQAERLRGGTIDSPSIMARVNATEWSLDKKVSIAPLAERLNELESRLTGTVIHTSLEDRSTKMAAQVLEAENAISVTVPNETLVRVKFIEPLNSRNAQVGDTAKLQVEEDVFQDGYLVFPKGALGQASVKTVRPAKRFARDGKMTVSFDYIEAIDGRRIHVIQGSRSERETATFAKAAGASIAGAIILGPIGLVGGAFLKGENVDIKEGSQLYIETDRENDILSIQIQ